MMACFLLSGSRMIRTSTLYSSARAKISEPGFSFAEPIGVALFKTPPGLSEAKLECPGGAFLEMGKPGGETYFPYMIDDFEI
jgi:hypothetical protein